MSGNLRGSRYPILIRESFWDYSDIRNYYVYAEEFVSGRKELLKQHHEIGERAVVISGYPVCHAKRCNAPILGNSDRRLCSEHGELMNPINNLYHQIRQRMEELLSEVRTIYGGENAEVRIRARTEILHMLAAMEVSLRYLLGSFFKKCDHEHMTQINQCYIYFRFFDFLLKEQGREYLTRPWGLLHCRPRHWGKINTLIKKWSVCDNQNKMDDAVRQYFVEWGDFEED